MPLQWLGYEEEIAEFSFRENSAIKIPKSVRKVAMSLQLDIQITSTDGNDYLNDKSNPSYGFYGYAVLVFRDHADIEIPIHQPRQRLYYGTSPDGYNNWVSCFVAQIAREDQKKLLISLSSISEGVGLSPSTMYSIPPCIPFFGFEEIPLREVYIKTRFGTRFDLEISHWFARPQIGQTDCDYTPESQKNDGDKDDGLPPNGVQPQKAPNASSPYSGFEPPSSNQKLGQWLNTKGDSLNNPDPSEAAYLDPTTLPNYDPVSGQWLYYVSRDSGGGGCTIVPTSPSDGDPYPYPFPPPTITEYINTETCPDGRVIGNARVKVVATGQIVFTTSGKYSSYRLLPASPAP